MKFSIFFSTALFATSILAAPRGHGLASRAERRATRTHSGAPLHLKHSKDVTDGENITHIDYSSNWAGAVLTAPPAGQTFNAVSGQFNVPTPSFPSGASSGGDSYAASVWVGIDGDTYQNAILQAGIDVTINSDGSYSFDSWYEWFPNYAIDFDTSAFSFTAGDEVSVSVTSSSSSKGKVVLNNLSTGQSVTQSVSAPDSSSTLGGQNAEWIVEDFEDNGGLVPFANFGSVLFTNAVAKTKSQTLGTSGADIIEIEDDNGNVLTTVSIPSSSEVQLVYS
jgi:Peptidase A4 family